MVLALDIQQLKKTYKNKQGREQVALKGIDLAVEEGDFFALLGPNGAGKSTTIGILCSLVNKTSGSVKVFGVDTDKDFPRAKSFLGVVPQEFNFSQFEKVFDIVVTQAGYYGLSPKLARERTEKYLHRLGLWEHRHKQARMLSGGMKRRMMIARALVHEPKLLVLDEPTAGVDIELRRSMWEYLTELNQQGITIILTTHYLEEAEQLCKRVAIIDHGEIIRNSTTRSLLAQLDRETLILDLVNPIAQAPVLEHCATELIDEQTVQVSVPRDHTMNALFQQLTAQQLQVKSIKQKSNRLEELFISLVQQNLGK